MMALHFLQNDLAQTVDHGDAEETKEVSKLSVGFQSAAKHARNDVSKNLVS